MKAILTLTLAAGLSVGGLAGDAGAGDERSLGRPPLTPSVPEPAPPLAAATPDAAPSAKAIILTPDMIARLALRPLSAFPLGAADLAPREYASTRRHWTDDGIVPAGLQDDGFDIGIRQWRNADGVSMNADSYSDLKATVSASEWSSSPKNEHFLIYGKPVYAMADGVVRGCWRNAPDNPVPGVKHPKVDAGFIAGGGNHVWIAQADGTTALYAHFIPQSMPQAICPHNDEYFGAPGGGGDKGRQGSPDVVEETVVVSGAAIKKGQFLGLSGNSGSTTAPHLHVHVERNALPVPIEFERGLATQLTAPNAPPESAIVWTKLRGETLPVNKNNDTLIWPAHANDQPFSRAGVEAGLAAGLSEHLADSGLWPGSVACGQTQNGVHYNFIGWVKAPKKAEWRVRFNLDEAQLQGEIAQAQIDGYVVDAVNACPGFPFGEIFGLPKKISVAVFKKL